MKWGKGNKSRNVEDSKKRDVRKTSREAMDSVRISARERKVFDGDHGVTRGDKLPSRERIDRFRPEELDEGNFEGWWAEKQVIREEDRKHGDSRRRHGKNLRQDWELEYGHKSHRHGGRIGFTKPSADRYFKFQRLPKISNKPRSRNEGYFKDNVERQGDSLAKTHKENSRGIADGSVDYHRPDCQDDQRESHRAGRRVDQDNNFPRNQRRILETATKERFVRQRRDRKSGRDSVKQNSDYQKSDKENVDRHSSSRGTDKPGSKEINVARHERDQKSGKENVDHSSGATRGTDQPESIDVKMARHQEDHKSSTENVGHSSRAMRGTEEPGSADVKLARHEVDQKSGKENNVDHSSRGTRGTEQPGSVDIKVATPEVDQKSDAENVDHSSRAAREIDRPWSVGINAATHEADQKPSIENVHHSSRTMRGTDQLGSVDIEVAKHEADQKFAKENVDHPSRGTTRTDQPGSIDIKVTTPEVDQKSDKETVDHSSRGTRGIDQPGSIGTKVVFQIGKGAGGRSRRGGSRKAITHRQPDKHEMEGIDCQNGGKRENACVAAKTPEPHSQYNSTEDNASKLQPLDVAESIVQGELGGSVEVPRQMALNENHGPDIASKDTLHQSATSPSIFEKRKRKNRVETPEEREKLRVAIAHEREKFMIQEGHEPKSILEKKDTDDFRCQGTTKQKSSLTETDAHDRMGADSTAPRKSDEALQLKRAKFSRRKKEKSNESLLRRQVGTVDRYKHDVSSQQEHKHQKRRRGRSHSVSPKDHKHFFSRKRVHGKSTSPRRSELRYIGRSSDWEKFERQRERERHKTLAAFDSRYRRFGGGTSGLGGYSPRRRRSDAAVKTPSPPPRSPERKKTKTWDSIPPGMDSSMITAISAAHQAAMQHTLARLATVNPLVPPNMLIRPNGAISVVNRLTSIPSLLPSPQPQINPAVTAVTLTQATRPLRRLYVGNVPSTVSDGELLEFINAAMLSTNTNYLPGTKPCINCTVNVEKNHAFAEFITPEDATAALAFDGVTLHGTALKIRRPKDFVQPSIIAIVVQNGGVESVSPVPDMVSSSVADSPHKVFVGGIPLSLTADKVKEIVTAFGQLKAYHWEVDNKRQPPQAFAFLEYMDPGATVNACAGLNGMRLGTGFLTVVQAIPDADTKSSSISAPFYGIPEHAKSLLEPPSCVLGLHNLVTAEEVPNMSKEEIEDLIEDVRLECVRFGNVKSAHMVHRYRSNPDLKTENMPSLGHIKVPTADINRGENLVSKDVQESAQKGCAVEGTKEELAVEQTETVREMSARLQVGSSFEVDMNEMLSTATAACFPNLREGSAKSKEENSSDTNECNAIHMGNANPRQVLGETDNEWQASISSASLVEKIIPPDGRGAVHVQDKGVSGSGREVDATIREWETSHLGKVYVEFSREESARQAAHALHGRLFDGHKVAVSYFPLDLYHTRFHKDCCQGSS